MNREMFMALGGALMVLAATVEVAAAQPSVREVIEQASKPESPKAAGTESRPEGASPTSLDTDPDRTTPRSAIEGFLQATRTGDYEHAAEYLDLRRLPRSLRRTTGPELAQHLKTVLDRTLWVDLEALSSDLRGHQGDGLPTNRDRVGYVFGERGAVELLLEGLPRSDGQLVWRISGATVAQIPRLYQEFGYGPLTDLLPAAFVVSILGLQLWQWGGLLLLAVLVYGAAGLSTRVIVFACRRMGVPFADRLAAFLTTPMRLAVAVLIFKAGTVLLRLPLGAQAVLGALEHAALIVAASWMLMRLVDSFEETLRGRLLRTNRMSAMAITPAARRTANAVIVGFAGIAMLNHFGFNVTALLAGLGVGSIAVALAAQRSIEDVFGALTLYGTHPVRVGDFCRFGDTLGHVEEIGLRATRIRTLDRTVVNVPNAEFASLRLENYSRRDKLLYRPRIGVRYETSPDQLRYLLVETRKLLYAHPKVVPSSARVRFVEFGAYSLDIEVFAYLSVIDYPEFLEVAEDLNLRIIDIVSSAGTGFAFPSQTTYLETGTPPDPERGRVAAATVKEWREQNALYLPRFPESRIRELAGTVEYPPKGAAVVP